MSKTTKMIILFVMLLAVVLLVPTICNATDVANEQALRDAIQNDDTDIKLTADIELKANLQVNKKVTIDGNGYTLSATAEDFEGGSGGIDKSIITSVENGDVTLKNITLSGAPKYGAQAWKGKLTFEGVTIKDCAFGGVLVNGGTITIRDLTLNTDTGIEVGAGVNVTSTPDVIMDGTIKSSSDKVIYMDPRTPSNLTIDNTENSEDKMYAHGNSVVITDKENNVISDSVLGDDITVKVTTGGKEETAKIYVVTIKYGKETKTITVKEGETLPELSDVKNAVAGKKFDGFYTSDGKIFDLSTKITSDIELTAKYKAVETSSEEKQPADEEEKVENEKDDTPNTGINSYLGIATTLLAVSSVSVIALKKKEA